MHELEEQLQEAHDAMENDPGRMHSTVTSCGQYYHVEQPAHHPHAECSRALREVCA